MNMGLGCGCSNSGGGLGSIWGAIGSGMMNTSANMMDWAGQLAEETASSVVDEAAARLVWNAQKEVDRFVERILPESGNVISELLPDDEVIVDSRPATREVAKPETTVPAKSRKGLWIALGITAVVVVGGVTTAVVVSKKKRGKR